VLDSREGLRAAVRAASVMRAGASELVLLTSDGNGVRAAANIAMQLDRYGIRHHMVLMPSRGECQHAQAMWAWLVCGWSAGLNGFERYRGTSMSEGGVRLWALWSAKWLLLARLVEVPNRPPALLGRRRA
jgi:hypothetical protein